MRKYFFILLSIIPLLSQAQAKEKVTVKGGTILTVAATENLRASNANVGDRVNMKVVRDVKVDGKVAIPAGSLVFGKVTEAKRSTCFGTKGRLSINLTGVSLANGESIPFTNSNINITGKNRTPLSVVIFCLTCLPFPCGSKAELVAGSEYEAMIANNVEIEL